MRYESSPGPISRPSIARSSFASYVKHYIPQPIAEVLILNTAVHLAAATVLAQESFEGEGQVVVVLHERDSTAAGDVLSASRNRYSGSERGPPSRKRRRHISRAKLAILGPNTFLSFRRRSTAHVLMSAHVSGSSMDPFR